MVDVKAGMHGSNRLIIFDVEGVLVPKRRYLLFETAKKVGLRGFIKIIAVGVLYEVGLLSLESALRKIFKVLRGLTTSDIFQLYEGIPLMPGVEEVFERLNKVGYKTALISSGLPKLLVKDLAARLGVDYAFGLELETANGRLTGEIGGDVLKPDGKAIVLKKNLEKEGLSSQDCVVVADDRNNLPMFRLCTLRVGYNPDFLLSAKSDFVVSGDLSEILPIVTENVLQVPSSPLSRSEIIREIIHVGSFLVPFICIYLLETYLVFLLILLATSLYSASEVARLRGINLPLISTITWKAANEPEYYEFATAPISFALGIMFSLILFPAPASYASIAILTLGDGFATIFGRKFGSATFPFNKGKKVEGSVFGFLFASVGAMLFVDPVKALVGAATGMLAECLPLPLSDNLTIPLASGLVLTTIL
ncbi:MAG: Phosphoserine phosphatase [Candidatus Bathyarchaeota archaeon BA2]|nr:MAG: Phosphoserine phosphatase [Candidatus Bathyarchaeota archaeon BA2]